MPTKTYRHRHECERSLRPRGQFLFEMIPISPGNDDHARLRSVLSATRWTSAAAYSLLKRRSPAPLFATATAHARATARRDRSQDPCDAPARWALDHSETREPRRSDAEALPRKG